jgi:lysophospholipase L1-like esterase
MMSKLMVVGLAVLGIFSQVGAGQPSNPDPNRFAAEIKAFAEWDSKNAAVADPILFVGSSSIRLWRTHESFPDLPVVNRGFGGSQISDVIHFFDRVVRPYKAKVIVFYCGNNDIAGGKSPERVSEDFRRFVQLVHADQPAARVVFLGILPSRSRWKYWSEVQKTNGLIAEFCKSDPRLVFADFGASFLGADGVPDSSLYLKDELHLNDKGYAIWNKALTPVLQKVLASLPKAGQ